MLARRLVQVLATVVLVALLVFCLMRLLPGDPAAMLILGERGQRRRRGPSSAGSSAWTRPSPSQFWQFLIHFDHGSQLRRLHVTMRVPVIRLIEERLPITLMLTGMAAAAGPADRRPARLRWPHSGPAAPWTWPCASSAQLSLSMPVFYIGLVLLIVLGGRAALVPGGRHRGRVLGARCYSLVLPALTLALSLSAILLRNLRDQLIEVLQRGLRGLRHRQGPAAPAGAGPPRAAQRLAFPPSPCWACTSDPWSAGP